MDSIDNSNAWLNIWYGAIRSSKTICSILAWIYFLSVSPHTEFLMSGRTRGSLYRNVLLPFFRILNALHIKYFYDRDPEKTAIYIGNKIIWVLGYSNEPVSEKIVGMTLAGWYADEINTHPKQAIENTLDRMSLEGARAFWTYNPDTPKEYISAEYTFNEERLSLGLIKKWHFILSDNLNLPQSYLDTLYARYPVDSIGYKRKILGIPAIPEGAIYDRFSEARHTFTNEDVPYSDYSYYVIGTDEGSGSTRVCGLFGIKRQTTGDEYHLLDEVFWDVTKHDGRQLTNKELMYGLEEYGFKGVMNMLEGRPLHAFITPHDASNLRAYLKQKYYQGKPLPVKTYTPSVIEDIERIREIIAEDRFKINRDNCPNVLEQIQGYIWDPKHLRRGESVPYKSGDHGPDMIRGPILGTRSLISSGYTRGKHTTPF